MNCDTVWDIYWILEFYLKADGEPCKGFDKNCEYTCSNKTGTVKCECPLGYQLAVNGISCRGMYMNIITALKLVK